MLCHFHLKPRVKRGYACALISNKDNCNDWKIC